MKKILFFVGIALFAMLFWTNKVDIKAQSGDIVGNVMDVEQDVDAYTSKDMSSDILASFSKGDCILVTGQEGEWITIFYRGKTGYIPTSASTSAKEDDSRENNNESDSGNDVTDAVQNDDASDAIKPPGEVSASFLTPIDNSGLEEEFEEQWEREVSYVDAIEEQKENQKENQKRSSIWRIMMVIVILLVVIIGVAPRLLPKIHELRRNKNHESGNHGRRKRKKNRRGNKRSAQAHDSNRGETGS